MKWLILLILFGAVLAILASRYRHQIRAARQIWAALKTKPNEESERGIGRGSGNQIQLIKCAVCGNWTPENNGLQIKSGTFYCSTECRQKISQNI